jgi:hypothetical protein
MLRFLVVAAALMMTAAVAVAARDDEEPMPNPTRLNCPFIDHVEDDQPIASSAKNDDEYMAYNYVVSFARKQSLDALAQNVRPELTFRRVFEEGRGNYRGELVRVRGWLKRLNWIESTELLKKEGIPHLYEGWVFDEDFAGYPWCVVFSELPPGLEPAEQMNRFVTLDGYFFKRYKYRAVKDTRLAPLVIGRSLTVKPPEPEPDAVNAMWSFGRTFVPVAAAGIAVIAGVAVALNYWFRRGDRQLQATIDQNRTNPFADDTPQP